MTHDDGAQGIEALFGLSRDLLRDREDWTRETLTLGTHNTTHVDAPWHYNSTIEGRPAETIDDIVLVRTGRDAFYTELDYIARGPGVSAEATLWLYDHGVRVMGIDAWGWDRPLHLQAADALRERRAGIFWEAHEANLRYSQIERLVGLDALPSTGFTVACFPLRLAGASAAPARVVAILDS